MSLAWRIYYGDGSTYSSADGPPERARRRNVLVIAKPDTRRHVGVKTVGWVLMDGEFFYWRTDVGEWFNAQTEGDFHDLIFEDDPPLPISIWLKGRYIPHQHYREIFELAQAWAAERDMPEKTMFAPGERTLR